MRTKKITPGDLEVRLLRELRRGPQQVSDLAAKVGCQEFQALQVLRQMAGEGLGLALLPHQGWSWQPEPTSLHPAAVLALMQRPDLWPGVEWHEALASTQVAAWDAVLRGEKDGWMVTTDRQWSGRGRHGRSWVEIARKGLAFSLVFRQLDRREAARLTLMASLVVSDVVQQWTRKMPRLKWPNDVMWQNRKLAGILTEHRGPHDGPGDVVVGIGLNVAQTDQDFPEGLRQVATSMRILSGETYPRAVVLASLLDIWQVRRQRDWERQLSEWLHRSGGLGQMVRVRGLHGEICGEMTGVDEEGRLLLRTDAGRSVTVHAGELVQ